MPDAGEAQIGPWNAVYSPQLHRGNGPRIWRMSTGHSRLVRRMCDINGSHKFAARVHHSSGSESLREKLDAFQGCRESLATSERRKIKAGLIDSARNGARGRKDQGSGK